jgi:hypothetical protein
MLRVALTLIALMAAAAAVQAQDCPLAPGRTGKFPTLSNDAGIVAFSSGLAVDIDGAPNAYHRVLGPTTRDAGLLHICNGASVLELRRGRMVDRYPDFSVPGSSARCKADFFELQERGFPSCDTGTCLRIFGFYAEPRSCGPGRASENLCGVPKSAVDPDGNPSGFFVSTTSLHDPRFDAADPRRYVDARTIPYFVLPDGENGPFGREHGVKEGDIALIVRGSRGVFAVFADAGPVDKLGEASAAVITRLAGEPDAMDHVPRPIASGVTTLILPGSRNLLAELPPRSARVIAEAGARALGAAGGLGAFAGCEGLGAPVEIVRE